jgi:hypothetical protein
LPTSNAPVLYQLARQTRTAARLSERRSTRPERGWQPSSGATSEQSAHDDGQVEADDVYQVSFIVIHTSASALTYSGDSQAGGGVRVWRHVPDRMCDRES